MGDHRQEAGVEALQEQEDIRVVQGGECNRGDFAVPEGHRYRGNQEWSIKTTHTRLRRRWGVGGE